MCRSQRDTLIVEVPLPPMEVSPNRRFDRRAKARAIACYREQVGFLAVAAARAVDWTPPEKVRLGLLWGLQDGDRRGSGLYHPRDADNAVAAAKALIDGLRDAGVIRDDNWASLKLGDVDATEEGGPWVRVTVERV